MIICQCNKITVDELTKVCQTLTEGPKHPEIFRYLGKRSQCGSCRSLLESCAELIVKRNQS